MTGPTYADRILQTLQTNWPREFEIARLTVDNEDLRAQLDAKPDEP